MDFLSLPSLFQRHLWVYFDLDIYKGDLIIICMYSRLRSIGSNIYAVGRVTHIYTLDICFLGVDKNVAKGGLDFGCLESR